MSPPNLFQVRTEQPREAPCDQFRDYPIRKKGRTIVNASERTSTHTSNSVETDANGNY
jgi:hypothetical protein